MKKMWYQKKKYWFSIIGCLLALLLIYDGVMYHSIHKAFHPTVSSASISSSDSDDSDGATSKNSITVDHKSYKYTAKKTYKMDQNYKDWSYADIHFSEVDIYQLAKEHKKVGIDEKKANCIVVIKMSVKANKDIEIFPDQATLSTNNGLQGDAVYTDDFSDDIDSGVTKDGNVIIPLDGVNNISDLKKLRLKFDAGAADDNDDSDDAFKTLDINFNLK